MVKRRERRGVARGRRKWLYNGEREALLRLTDHSGKNSLLSNSVSNNDGATNIEINEKLISSTTSTVEDKKAEMQLIQEKVL